MSVNVWRVTAGVAVTTDTENQVATASQTVFTLTSMTYVVGGNLQVFVNGVKQIKGASDAYVETSTTVVTFNVGLDVGDDVQFMNQA